MNIEIKKNTNKKSSISAFFLNRNFYIFAPFKPGGVAQLVRASDS